MEFDADQRRAAFRTFMARAGLTNVSAWEQASGLSGGTLRHFLKGKSNTMTDQSYTKLAAGAEKLVGRAVALAELQSEDHPTQRDHNQNDQFDVIPTGGNTKAVLVEGEPLIVFRAESGSALGGNTLIYKEKVGEMDRVVQFQHTKDAFCFAATDDLMRPAFRTRDILVVDPAKACTAEDDCLFVKDPLADPLDTVARQLVRITPTAWIVCEHGGRKTPYELSRDEYPKAWVIVTVHKR